MPSPIFCDCNACCSARPYSIVPTIRKVKVNARSYVINKQDRSRPAHAFVSWGWFAGTHKTEFYLTIVHAETNRISSADTSAVKLLIYLCRFRHTSRYSMLFIALRNLSFSIRWFTLDIWQESKIILKVTKVGIINKSNDQAINDSLRS